ncbi:MAG: winged helix-turn-helix transcriptional regulator [Candidatus Zixiibacteriota bacterium]|nr:MAG: winged helix-turn-helix transcriptional regulator [candidate division Zixibacteria bacterium]
MADLSKLLMTWGLDEKKYSKYFKAFGDPTRQKILVFLSSGEKTVNEIAKAVGISQPTASRHLAILRDAGAIADRREGQKIFCRLDRVSIKDCCISFCDCLDVPYAGTNSPKNKKKWKK